MAEVEISYKGSTIASMSASGTKTLLTEGKYLEDDVEVTYTRPAAPSGTKNISITANGTTTEDVTNYASAQITANVQNTYSAGDEGKVVSNGALVAQGSDTVTQNDPYDTTLISSLTVNVSGGGGALTPLKWKASRNASIGLSGIILGHKGAEIDLNNKSGFNVNIGNYFAFEDPNGEYVIKNLNSSLSGSQMNAADSFRAAPAFKVVDLGGMAPATMTRWFKDWHSSQNGLFPTAPIIVRNLRLDNLSSVSDSFSVNTTSSWHYHNFDVYFTGELKNNLTMSSCSAFNADSWNRLIECLYDYSEGTAHTLTVGSTILAMIDATHQAMAAARGWTLA